MKRGRSVEPVRLRRRTGSAHGALAPAEGEPMEFPGREDRRGLAGKFSCQRASQLDGHQNRSAEVTARLLGGARRLRTRAVRARRQGSYFLELLLADGETRRSAVADSGELLAVADNLQRALAAIGEEARRQEGSLIEGVEATRRLLTPAFERFRVRPIEALGKRFDPMLHQAVATEAASSRMDRRLTTACCGRPASSKSPARCHSRPE